MAEPPPQAITFGESMTFRLSHKLNSKIKAGTLPTLPPEANPFADWSAHLFVAGRTQYIILSNTQSLYSTVMYGRGITDDNRFIRRSLSGLREALEDDGQEFVYRRFIAPASGTVRFARALDRAVTGSMNELIVQATAYLVGGELSPFDVGLRLNEILLSALAATKADKYGTPRGAFKSMADAIGPGGA
jgi:hypothetical protein